MEVTTAHTTSVILFLIVWLFSYEWFRSNISILPVFLVIASTTTLTAPYLLPQSNQIPLEDQIFLKIANGEDWGGPQGLQLNLMAKTPMVVPNKFIADKQYELSFYVYHEIQHTTLKRVGIYLRIPDAIDIQPTTLWKHRYTRSGNKEYLYLFSKSIVNGRGVITEESLFLTFPQSDEYPISYTISGSTQSKGFNKIKRSFLIQLK